MKKRIIVTATITACLALYAAVLPQAETVGKTPAPPQTPAVSAPKAAVAEREAAPLSEKEKANSLQPEPLHTIYELGTVSTESPALPEVQPIPRPDP